MFYSVIEKLRIKFISILDHGLKIRISGHDKMFAITSVLYYFYKKLFITMLNVN
uniref:Uncharacterized protein n=1 Tax=uncultured Desulfobacterium sp. TaxID=201089 RepID=E1YBQ7_9BACT|nr:unknown protein [uncultured Desulfobacterium sp.]